MTSRLEALPPELLLRIIDYIPRPMDLQALCLTSKALRVPATTGLYHDVTLDHRVPTWRHGILETKAGFFSSTNPGLPQIRKLWLRSGYDRPTEEENEAVETVLNALPMNTLRTFECEEFAVDEEAVMTLLMRQQNIAHLALGPITFNLAPFLKAGFVGQQLFASLRHLEIPHTIDSFRDLKAYQHIIEHSRLQSLSILVNWTRGDSNEQELMETSDGYEKLLCALFPRIKSQSQGSPVQLEKLALQYFDLGQSARLLPLCVDLSKLQTLVLDRCPAAGKLFAVLASHFTDHGSQLKRFEFQVANDADEQVGSRLTERLLHSFSGLESLELLGYDGVTSRQSLAASVLKKHGDTLERLWLHPQGYGNWASDELAIKQDLFDSIAKYCPKLRQVAIILPKYQLSHATNAQKIAYGKAMRALLHLPDLQVLRIFNYPHAQRHFFSELPEEDKHDIIQTLNRTAYEHALDQFMVEQISELFDGRYRDTKHPIVCFKSNGKVEIPDGTGTMLYEEPRTYVPTPQFDVFGRKQVVLRAMEFSEVKYFEPEYDVLEWP